jgi:hypothetical protein
MDNRSLSLKLAIDTREKKYYILRSHNTDDTVLLLSKLYTQINKL